MDLNHFLSANIIISYKWPVKKICNQNHTLYIFSNHIILVIPKFPRISLLNMIKNNLSYQYLKPFNIVILLFRVQKKTFKENLNKEIFQYLFNTEIYFEERL